MLIRPVTPNDAGALLDIYRPYIERSTFTFETEVPAIDDFRQRIEHYTANYPWLVAEADEQVIGYAYASRHRERTAYQWCVESSVYVKDEFHGCGIALKLYDALFDLLSRSGYVNVYAGITLPNPASYSFHLKAGFKPVGVYEKIGFKLGQWCDVAWLVKQINPHADTPQTPMKYHILQ